MTTLDLTAPTLSTLLEQSAELHKHLCPRQAIISRNGVRAVCDQCGEEIINEREVHQDGRVLCRSCVAPAYDQPDRAA